MLARHYRRFASSPSAMMALPLLLLAPTVGTAPRDPNAGAAAPFHLHLLKSTPAADASLAKSPSEIRLVFSSRVTLATIDLRDASGKRIAVSKTKLSVSASEVIGHGKDSVINKAGIAVAALGQPLKNGVYELNWKATGSDGHAVHNHFGFAIGQPMPAHASSGDQDGDHDHDDYDHGDHHGGTGKSAGR